MINGLFFSTWTANPWLFATIRVDSLYICWTLCDLCNIRVNDENKLLVVIFADVEKSTKGSSYLDIQTVGISNRSALRLILLDESKGSHQKSYCFDLFCFVPSSQSYSWYFRVMFFVSRWFDKDVPLPQFSFLNWYQMASGNFLPTWFWMRGCCCTAFLGLCRSDVVNSKIQNSDFKTVYSGQQTLDTRTACCYSDGRFLWISKASGMWFVDFVGYVSNFSNCVAFSVYYNSLSGAPKWTTFGLQVSTKPLHWRSWTM